MTVYRRTAAELAYQRGRDEGHHDALDAAIKLIEAGTMTSEQIAHHLRTERDYLRRLIDEYDGGTEGSRTPKEPG